MSKNLLHELESLVDSKDLQYLSNLIRSMFLQTEEVNAEVLTSGIDISTVVNLENVECNTLLVKELALSLDLIRPANGKSEKLYFLTLKGFTIGRNEKSIDVLKKLISDFVKGEYFIFA